VDETVAPLLPLGVWLPSAKETLTSSSETACARKGAVFGLQGDVDVSMVGYPTRFWGFRKCAQPKLGQLKLSSGSAILPAMSCDAVASPLRVHTSVFSCHTKFMLPRCVQAGCSLIVLIQGPCASARPKPIAVFQAEFVLRASDTYLSTKIPANDQFVRPAAAP